MRKKFLVLLIFVMTTLLLAQSAKALQIAGVSVDGNDTISKELILRTSGLSEGRLVYGEDFQDAIKKLWGLGLFSNIMIDADDAVGDKVFLKIIVEEYPRLSKVRVSGVDELEKDEVEESIKLLKGQVITESDIQKVKNDLKDLYFKENYLLTEIDIEKSYVQGNKVELYINITEGEKIYIETITFHGNKAFEKDDLLDEFEETKEDRWWRDGDYDREKFEGDLLLLESFYKNNGYKDIEIERDSVYYNDTKDEMYIDIWLNEGKLYYFGDVSFEGNTIFSDEEMQSLLEFEKGDTYSQIELDMSIHNSVGSLYYDRGYLRSQIMPEEEIFGEDTINVKVRIVEGGKSRVRKINIRGNTRTIDKVIRRELSIYPGDVFNRSKLFRSQRDVFMLNYFDNVVPNIDPADDLKEDEVDLVFEVKEKSTETAQTAVSYSKTDGFVGSLGFTFNNFSFKEPFVRGDGQKLYTNVEFGRNYYKYLLGVEEPWLWDRPTLVGASGNYQKRRESYGDTYIIGGTVKVGRRFAWLDNWVRGLWVYNIERIKYDDVKEYAKDRYDLYDGKKIVSSSLTQYIIRNSKDRPEFPTRGSEVSLMTKLAGGVLGGDEGFHKHRFEFKWYQPLIKDRLVIMNQYVLGAMDKLSESSYISANEYFYMGGGGLSGGEPLRGYDENSVGPYDKGYYIGGRNMFKTSVELRMKLTDDPMLIYALGFYDAGNVWRDFKSTDVFDLRRSAGLGLRIFMPMIGMIGFDYGYGFDYYQYSDNKRKGEWMPHFRMGTNL